MSISWNSHWEQRNGLPWLSRTKSCGQSQVSKGLCLSRPLKPHRVSSRQCTCCFSPHAPSLSKNLDHQWSRIQNFFYWGDMIKCIFYLLLNTHIGVWRNIPYTSILVFLLQNLGIFIEIRKKNIINILIISFFCQLSLPWVYEIFQLIQL